MLELDRSALAWGLLAVVVAVALVLLGSSGLTWFDAALVGYLFGSLFAIFGVVYRYVVWTKRPPTRKLNQRGWEALWAKNRRLDNLRSLPVLVVEKLLTQGFIRRRSRSR